MSQERKLAYLPVAKIIPNPAALRPVNKTSDKYLELVNSVRHQGVLKPILVHETQDEQGELAYGLSDGAHRFSAANDCGLDTIPCHIVPLAESEVLITQIMANVHTIETKPAQYADALIRIMGEKPTMTLNEMCTKLDKSPGWLSDTLSLVNLSDKVKALVDDGKINLTNAYALAKLAILDPNEETSFFERAQVEGTDVFVPTVNARIKEIKEARKKGLAASAETFTPVAHARSVTDLKKEFENGTIAAAMVSAGRITSVESFKAGIAYAIKLDEDTIAAAQEKWAASKQEKANKKEKADLGKKEKAFEDAKKVLESMGAQVITPVQTGTGE